jgi:hypothetical protein
MVVHRFPDRCGPSADQGIGSSGCRPHCLGWRRPTQAAAWSSGGAGDDRTDLANNGPCRDGEPSPLRIAARPRPDLTGQPRMAGLGMQAGSPLSHQLFGRVRMQHRGLLRDDKLHRPYLDGSARLGQCHPSPLAGAPQHLGLRIRLTSCMPCSFGLLPHPRSGRVWPAQSPSPSDRDCPLRTAGDRCLWHAGGTASENNDARTRRRRLRNSAKG